MTKEQFRWLIGTIITGLGVVAAMLALLLTAMSQNHALIGERFNDIHALIAAQERANTRSNDATNARIDEMRSDMNAGFSDVMAEIRLLRAPVIASPPATDGEPSESGQD